MERYLQRSSSSSSLNAKRAGDDLSEEWRAPKRYAPRNSPQEVSLDLQDQNQFKDLPVHDVPSDPKTLLRNASTAVKKTSHIPPITICIEKEWTHQTIREIVSKHTNRFHLQYRNGDKVAISCFSAEAHQAVKDGFRKDGISFITYTRKDEKTPKVVLKGLPDSVEEILPEQLESLGFKTTSITKLKSKNNTYQSCPPFLVQLAPGADLVQFRRIKYLCDCVVRIEKFKPNHSQGTQCYRCQGFGHSSQNCNLPARCVKCTSQHTSSECPKKDRKTPAKCCNCDGEHPANYRNCSARIKYLERLHAKIEAQREHIPPVLLAPRKKSNNPITSSKTWAEVAGVTTSNMKPSVVAGSSCLEPSVHASSDDPVCNEMLQILSAIQKLKFQFAKCTSHLEKVTLVLTHLGHYV